MKWITYSAIFGTILIVVAIAAKLSGLGTAEVTESNDYDEMITVVTDDPNGSNTGTGIDITVMPEPNDLWLTWNEVYLEVTLAEEPNFAETDRIYLYEGDEFNIVIEKVEPNDFKTHYTAEELDEIYKDEPALGRLVKDLWGVGEGRIKIVEPNEPIQELTKLFEQVLDHEGRLIDVVGICLERIEKLEGFHKPFDPNEFDFNAVTLTLEVGCKHDNRITCSVYGCGCWSCMDCNESWEPNELLIESSNEPYIYPSPMEYEPFTCITQLIPTWPDYIELEKTLILRYDFNEPIEYDTLDGKKTLDCQTWEIGKGTKIYFKE